MPAAEGQTGTPEKRRPSIRVLDVRTHADHSGALVGQHLDAPSPGTIAGAPFLDIRGWVLGTDTAVGYVEVIHRRTLLVRSPVTRPRKDVGGAYPDHPGSSECGYHARTSVAGLPRRLTLHIVACLSDGRRVALADVDAEHDGLRSGFQPTLAPVLLTSLGRTGTTVAMRLLGELPGVVVYRRYPHELGLARYWMHVLRVLAQPANHLQSSHPDTFSSDLWQVGHNPYLGDHLAGQPELLRRLGSRQVEMLTRFCQASIESAYLELAREQAVDCPRYFVEKLLPDHVPVLLSDLYAGSREIILVRDPRDVLCSLIAFNAKRGFALTRTWQDVDGLPKLTTEPVGVDQLVDRLAIAFSDLQMAATDRVETAMVVRYEDLIEDPLTQLERIAGHLGIDAGPDELEGALRRGLEETEATRHHRTTPDAMASVGRWRRHLAPEVAAKADAAFDEALTGFGYRSAAAAEAAEMGSQVAG